MTRMIAVLAINLLIIGSPAFAKDDPALKAAVEAYMQHPVTQRTLDDLLSADTMESMLTAQLQARDAKLRSDQTEVLNRIIHEEISRLRPKLEAAMANSALETYSLDEIEAFVGFLNTEIGARAMAKAGKMQRLFLSKSTPLLQQLFQRIGTRVDKELPK